MPLASSAEITMSDLALTLYPEALSDAQAIEKLHERAFGPGRFARTASRMRDGSPADIRLSFVARVGTLLVGSLRQTPVCIQGAKSAMLGPLTVEPAFEGRGIGRTLIERSLRAAREAGYQLVILVGDEPYYSRFGFRRVPMGRLVLPGPVDPARLLYLELQENALQKVTSNAVTAA